ncbi:MAG: rRNA pseudouridine synthase [Candidatus Cardinium sp.]|uniref:pseudouridine synthase n=1 Tax=Cardinium endosymbiont of Dermatophagoides farinae TaxID=2597823 RepID=UPI0011844BCC|nr:pseudouridine synthase [Cardinium endosymbiont of Dermatophagoides farinae]TSJ80853.1 rRNA pseudouridine synthase [Cardinium endosymbiont of Dermatophagoides farinae]UWW96857.1 MAG: rRNA pseudouridine synthase [Candidatus Cardinium sp.]
MEDCSAYLSSLIRLNKLISNAGLCARREADQLIESGCIAVNGVVVQRVGTKIPIDAVVTYKGVVLHLEKRRYILLNKPRGYVTTMQDPEGRKTVLDLIGKQHCAERVYPVGRLDYDTTGLLLLTNDGELARKLSHPANKVQKLYHAVLDRAIQMKHLDAIRQGLILEDGLAKVDQVAIVAGDPTQIGLAIHMGKNRIIRRIFSHLGYLVHTLDRVGYAHLTKQHIPRGKWIFLKDQEVRKLKSLV